jgi:hypothetical protein
MSVLEMQWTMEKKEAFKKTTVPDAFV